MRSLKDKLPTDSQAAVLDTIDVLEERLGRIPKREEVAKEYGTSPGCIGQHLTKLKRKGFITWERGQAGTLRSRGLVVCGEVG